VTFKYAKDTFEQEIKGFNETENRTVW